MTELMTIGGEPASAGDHFDVVNPATGAPFATAPQCPASLLDDAMEAARSALAAWGGDDGARRRALGEAADRLVAAVEVIAPILTAEQGKPLGDARLEVLGAALWLRYFADLDIAPEVIQNDKQARIEVQRRPMGVVAAITPWNFPIVLACWKLGPALRAGNTVVLKPSPFTPLSTLAMGSVLAGALPPGVLNVVSGTDPLGEWMTSHPVPRKVSFTGSIATGKRVAAAAATDLKRVTLELGGNDPAIVLDDADPNAIADSLFSHAFANCGQVCIAIKRVYAPEAMVADLVESLADRARRTVVGDGMDEATELGPINNLPQLERVTNLVDDALAHGARAVAGGHRLDRPGYFFAPTIIDRAHDGLKVVDEEQFGPVLPVVAYRDVEDAVAAANGTNYGLCASVWSSDPDRAERVANRLECGTAWINTHLEVAPHQPFSGVKWSGIGVENGRRGLDEFCELQVIHRPQGPPLLDHRQS